MLAIQNLTISRSGVIILKDLNLELVANQIAVLFAPNGSGKTTLAQLLCSNPEMTIVSGRIILDQNIINDLNSTQRAKLGIFTSFQNPPEIAGVTTLNLIKESYTAVNGIKPIAKEFLSNIKKYNQLLGLKQDFYKQDFNVGASGGEKKKNELLQMLMLQPKVVILDEVDSGLDTASKDKLVEILKDFKDKKRTILVITHDQDFYRKLKPDKLYTIQNQKLISL